MQKSFKDTTSRVVGLQDALRFFRGRRKAVAEENVDERRTEIAKSSSDETKTFPRNQDGKFVFTGSCLSQHLKMCRWLKRTF